MRALAAFLLLVGGCSLDLDSLRGGSEMPADAASHADGAWAMADATAPTADAPIEAADANVEAPTCGRVGLPCCNPGTRCDSGACLRGTCAIFGGAFGSMSACSPDCQTRNPYTAGCSCPSGFSGASMTSVLGSCGGDASATSLTVCAAPTLEPGGDFAGAFVLADGDGCERGCLSPNPRTGDCTCASGSVLLPLSVELAATCGVARAVLGVCAHDGAAITFEGAFQRGLDGSCAIANRHTGDCACSADSLEQLLPTMPTAIHLCAR